MRELAEQVADDDQVDQLIERWDGRPDLLAEDILQAKNLKTEEIEDLELFRPYQPRIMHAYFYGPQKILNIYKGRRIGVSFTIGICILLEALMKPDTFYPILSKTKGQSNSRIRDIKTLIENAKIEIELTKDNQDELQFPNGSRIKAYTGDPDSARGEDSPTTVFADEMAFFEDQQATLDAYLPTISLGNSQMVQVSTPKTTSDEFLKTNERGTRDGKNDHGVLSMELPTFKDADEINPDRSLFAQDVVPIRDDFDLQTAETQRAQDPNGFSQEYLCRPISDEYRFFSMDKIEEAGARGMDSKVKYGNPPPDPTNSVVMGVDIGFNSDDTALVVFEHEGPRRYLRYHEIIDDRVLSQAAITPASRQNPAAIAKRISMVHSQMEVDSVVMDMTGVGQGFHDEVRRRIGRGYTGFNFSDKEAVEEMMGNFNYALHNDLMYLRDDEPMQRQLGAIVKKQKHDWSKPKFSGKDHAPNGKDDLAMATVMAAYPPNVKTEQPKEPEYRENDAVRRPDRDASTDAGDNGFRGAKIAGGRIESVDSSSDRFGIQQSDRTANQRYSTRHKRGGNSPRR